MSNVLFSSLSNVHFIDEHQFHSLQFLLYHGYFLMKDEAAPVNIIRVLCQDTLPSCNVKDRNGSYKTRRYKYLLNKKDPPTCDLCKLQLTVKYIIIHYRKYIVNRHQLHTSPSLTDNLKKNWRG